MIDIQWLLVTIKISVFDLYLSIISNGNAVILAVSVGINLFIREGNLSEHIDVDVPSFVGLELSLGGVSDIEDISNVDLVLSLWQLVSSEIEIENSGGISQSSDEGLGVISLSSGSLILGLQSDNLGSQVEGTSLLGDRADADEFWLLEFSWSLIGSVFISFSSSLSGFRVS